MEICIIKLGADGDVLRTLALAEALKKKYKAKITWITRGDISEIVKLNKSVDEVFTIPYSSNKKFDRLYNFDVEKDALELADKISAKDKYGFYEEGNYPAAYNLGGEYYLNTMFDDELKKKNRKTYQEIMFDAAELEYKPEPYTIQISPKMKKYSDNFFKNNKLGNKEIIGIHMGASSRWPSKAWHVDNVKRFLKIASKDYDIILFGGPNEIEKQNNLVEECKKEGIKIFRNNPENTKEEFVALVNICEKIVCSDSLALHVSVGLGKKTLGLFFCTSPYEVEGYKLVTKIVSPMFSKFFPERMNEYNEELVKSIKAEEVFKAL